MKKCNYEIRKRSDKVTELKFRNAEAKKESSLCIQAMSLQERILFGRAN